MGLDSQASKIGRFTYYPEISLGYAGFTDHHAMRCDLNNWLLKEPDDMQYWLAGFGTGFVEAVARFCRDAGDTESTRHLIFSSEDAKAITAIGWLQRLQLSGVDNGPPSTANLLSALHGMCQALEDDGPIRTEYWPKQNETALLASDSRASRAEKIHQARQRGLDLSLSIR
jgi:hypothetical protein